MTKTKITQVLHISNCYKEVHIVNTNTWIENEDHIFQDELLQKTPQNILKG